jgi:hypothetical protein
MYIHFFKSNFVDFVQYYRKTMNIYNITSVLLDLPWNISILYLFGIVDIDMFFPVNLVKL